MSCLFYLVTIFLFLHIFVTASPLIRDSCKKAAAKDRKLNLNFCIQSLEGNPHSKTAKNLTELTLASLENGGTKAKSLKENMKKNLDERKYPKDSEMQIRECLELYRFEAEGFELATEEIQKHNYSRAIMHIDEGFLFLDACETKFKERVTPTHYPFRKEQDVLTQLLKIPLAFTNMLK